MKAKSWTPTAKRTFRVRHMSTCKGIVEGLINHRQWFTFRPLLDTSYPDDQYEFDVDARTPESGYGFKPTRDLDLYESDHEYGLEITALDQRA